MAKQWRPFQPAYSPGTYTRIGLRNLSDKELEREYTRVRRDAQERLRSFARSNDPDIRGADVVAEKAGLYLNRAQIKAVGGGRALMEDLLIDAYRFVSAKTSSVTGFRRMREKQVETMQAKGYNFITEGNIKEFGNFMDYFRSRMDAKAYGSGAVALAFNAAKDYNQGKKAKEQITTKQLQTHFKFYLAVVQGWDVDVRNWAKSELGKTDDEISKDFLSYFEQYKAQLTEEKQKDYQLQKFKRKSTGKKSKKRR